MCTPPYLLPSWTLLKPSLCLYRQAARDDNSCGVIITVDGVVEEPLVHRGSDNHLHNHITVALLSDSICELDASPNRGRRWLVLLVSTQSKDKTLLLKSKGRDPVLSRVPYLITISVNVNKPLTGMQYMLDACCGEFTQLTMEVL